MRTTPAEPVEPAREHALADGEARGGCDPEAALASTISYLEQDRSALNDQVVRVVAPDKRKLPLGP